MRVVHQTVEDGVGDGGITNGLMPVLHGELARHHGGPPSVPVLQDLQQVSALVGSHGRKTPIIEDQELDAHQAFEQACVAAVALSQG